MQNKTRDADKALPNLQPRPTMQLPSALALSGCEPCRGPSFVVVKDSGSIAFLYKSRSFDPSFGGEWAFYAKDATKTGNGTIQKAKKTVLVSTKRPKSCRWSRRKGGFPSGGVYRSGRIVDWMGPNDKFCAQKDRTATKSHALHRQCRTAGSNTGAAFFAPVMKVL